MSLVCIKKRKGRSVTFSCFQSEIVTIRNQLQGKVAEMESFAGHLEEIFLTVEVNVTLEAFNLVKQIVGMCFDIDLIFYGCVSIWEYFFLLLFCFIGLKDRNKVLRRQM